MIGILTALVRVEAVLVLKENIFSGNLSTAAAAKTEFSDGRGDFRPEKGTV